ncbi:MAG: Ig-like domain-containing protein, partial [Pseudomonadota bacterium]
AMDDMVALEHGGSADFEVLANDADPDGDDLTIVEAVGPEGVTVEILNGTKLRVAAAEGIEGDLTITYVVTDGNGNEDTAVMVVDVATAPEPDFSATFAVYDALTNQLIDTALTNGEEIQGNGINIAAAPSESALVGSASFFLDGSFVRTENVEPYAVFGDRSGDFFSGDLSPGAHSLDVRFFSGERGTGDLLGSDSIVFNVAEDAPSDPPDGPIDPVDPPTVPETLAEWADHIVFHFDGNNNDPDDIAALVSASLMTAAAGTVDKTTFLYGNNLSEPNKASQLAELEESADFARSLGIEAKGYQDNVAGTTAYLADLLSSGQKILALEGGPMEAIYRALEAVDPALHSNVRLVSHSGWNENRNVVSLPGATEARTWSDIRNDFANVQLIEIRDQNQGSNNDSGLNNRNWDWMDDSSEPVIQAARAAMEGANLGNPSGSKKNDASDSGMLWYALTGHEDGTPQDVESYLATSGLYDQPYKGTEPDPVDPTPEGNVAFSLIDATTDQVIDTDLTAFEVIQGTDFNIVATPEIAVESAVFRLNGAEVQIENLPAYALFGNQGNNYRPGTLDAGTYDLEVEFFSQNRGQGQSVAMGQVTFVVAAEDLIQA